jgi:hypothetical protein
VGPSDPQWRGERRPRKWSVCRGKLSWRKRKAREDERNARLAELEAENAQLRALLAGKSK